MITAKALKRHLRALGKELAERCYCDNPDCGLELYHPYEPGEAAEYGVPPYGMTLVTPEGNLDEVNNKEYIGRFWGAEAQHDEVLEQIELLDDWAENLVVVEHATGRYWRGTEFPG